MVLPPSRPVAFVSGVTDVRVVSDPKIPFEGNSPASYDRPPELPGLPVRPWSPATLQPPPSPPFPPDPASPPPPTTGDFAHFYIPSSRASHFTVTGIISSISATGSPGGNLQWADRSRAHYIITFNRDVINSPLGFRLLSCLTGAGGRSDCGIGMKFLERVSSRQIRVWFVRGDGTSSTYVRNVRITRF